MGVAVEYHEFESGHYISDFNVGVLDQWLKQRLVDRTNELYSDHAILREGSA
jgi:hypothetical protein